MKKWMIGLALVLLAVPAAARHEVRTIDRNLPIGADDTLRLDIAVAEVEIEGGAGDEVEVRLVIECSSSRKCEERAEKLDLESRSTSQTLNLSIKGRYKGGRHDPSLELWIRVPKTRAVEVEMGVGELEIRGMENDLEVDLGVGEVEISIPETAVRAVFLEVGVGKAELHPRKANSSSSGFLFLGNEVEWDDGPGSAQVEVDVGVGEVEVDLD